MVDRSPTEEKAVAGEQYTVQPGDTLWSIAEEAYGSGYNAQDVIAANKVTNPNQLKEGTVIILPKVEAKAPTRGDTAGQSADAQVSASITQMPTKQDQTPKSYTVKSGDNLWNIAVQVYGDGYQWTRIAEANKLANPHIIHAGNQFLIPSI